MVEMIKNEIIECKNPITWDDISGLQFAKNTIQVCKTYYLFYNLLLLHFHLLGICDLASLKT